MKIIFIGYRGVGKTTLTRMVAQKLNMPMIEIDDEIVKKSGRTIPEIFTQNGEAFFRELEKQAIEKATRKNNVIISVGGGAIQNPTNCAKIIKDSVVFWLEASPKEIFRRTKGDTNRPSLTKKKPFEEIIAMLKHRKPMYERTSNFRINTESQSPEQCVEQVLEILSAKNCLAYKFRGKKVLRKAQKRNQKKVKEGTEND